MLINEKPEKLFEADIDARLVNSANFSLYDADPNKHIKDILVPVMYSAVKGDQLYKESEIIKLKDATPGKKRLDWIEGNKPQGGEYSLRFDAYNYW